MKYWRVSIAQPMTAGQAMLVPDPARGFVPVPSSHQLRVFGAFSRRIREGMTRVSAAADDPDLLVSAFEGSMGRTLVLLNRAPRPRYVRVDWSDAGFRQMEVVDPYRENEVRAAPPLADGAVTLDRSGVCRRALCQSPEVSASLLEVRLGIPSKLSGLAAIETRPRQDDFDRSGSLHILLARGRLPDE